MQGIAGFFRNVIKPYSMPTLADDTPVPESSLNSTKTLPAGADARLQPEVKEELKSEIVTKSTVIHDDSLNEMRETVYDLIKDIRDPEKPNSLEDLDVVSEDNICVCKFNDDSYLIQITFVPTVPHCSLASLIGLCLRQKLIQEFPERHKLDIFIKEGTHETADDVNKQINDKERITAALENPNLRELVDQCISNDFG